MIGFVYKWTNKINGKMYIGAHIGEFGDGYIGSGTLFRKAIKKYGIDNFEREIIYIEEKCKDNLFINEARIVQECGAVEDDLYYNLVSLDPKHLQMLMNNGFSFTRRMTPETRDKMRTVKTGVKMSEEAKKNMSNARKGCVFSEEHRQHLSEAQKGIKNHCFGKKHSDEHRQKISASITGIKNPFYGKTHSAETLARISEKAKVNNAGANNPAAKAIRIDGVVYPTIKDACETLNLKYSQIKKIGEIV